MRPLILVLTAAAVLGACAGSSGHTANACLDRCANTHQSALERSTCEMQCQPNVSTAPAPAPAPEPVVTTPAPAPAPVVSQPTPTPVATTPVATAPVATAPVATAPVATTPVTTAATPKSDPAEVARCQSSCDLATSSQTDRATCRLNCSSSSTVVQPGSSYYVLQGSPPSDAAQRDAVIRSSGNVVQGGATQPALPPTDPQRASQCSAQAQQCANSCSGLLAPCTASCDADRTSQTDRATCKLTCETNTEVCVDDCRAKEIKCRGAK